MSYKGTVIVFTVGRQSIQFLVLALFQKLSSISTEIKRLLLNCLTAANLSSMRRDALYDLFAWPISDITCKIQLFNAVIKVATHQSWSLTFVLRQAKWLKKGSFIVGAEKSEVRGRFDADTSIHCLETSNGQQLILNYVVLYQFSTKSYWVFFNFSGMLMFTRITSWSRLRNFLDHHE